MINHTACQYATVQKVSTTCEYIKQANFENLAIRSDTNVYRRGTNVHSVLPAHPAQGPWLSPFLDQRHALV